MENKRRSLSDTIMPALMHRIPLELRSEVCLGESSTGIGDVPGSLLVVSLILFFWSVLLLLDLFVRDNLSLKWSFRFSTKFFDDLLS